MTYFIAQPCIGVKDGACVQVCPVECIHTNDQEPMYYIDPTECIDCGACLPVCPVGAIFVEGDAPKEYEHYQQLNAAKFETGNDEQL